MRCVLFPVLMLRASPHFALLPSAALPSISEVPTSSIPAFLIHFGGARTDSNQRKQIDWAAGGGRGRLINSMALPFQAR